MSCAAAGSVYKGGMAGACWYEAHTQPHTVHSGTAVVLQWRCRRRAGGFKASLWLGLSVEAKKRPKGPHYGRNPKTLPKKYMSFLPAKIH